MTEVTATGNTPVVGLRLNGTSGPRLRRMLDRHPQIADWPAFKGIELLFDAEGGSMDIEEDRFDAFFALVQIINAEITLDDDAFDEIAQIFIQKICSKGKNGDGATCPFHQIVDIAYECQIALLHRKLLGNFAKIIVKDADNPDHVFSVHLLDPDQESHVAIECKNIRKSYKDIRDFTRAVKQAILEKKVQAEGRTGYTDFLVYIDLPIEFLLKPALEFDRLITSVWKQLELEGVKICESQVIFTATSQTRLATYLSGMSDGRNIGMTMFRPVVCGKDNATVRIPRALLLSMLFRDDEENANISNWSRTAMVIKNPERLLFGEQVYEP